MKSSRRWAQAAWAKCIAPGTRLGRDVAIKVLPDSFANDADRLQRFEQEARVLGTLSHPNLLAIYDVGAQGEIRYLVSEYLEGQTLRERLSADPLSQHKVIEYAQQIAKGLAAAHDNGSVHRDLKSENIFVTRDGHVKVLDFGLAKQSSGLANPPEGTASLTGPTLTAPGTVMSTAGYMSPEQVRGQATDHRSDIFTFGAVLYEMITRKRAFKGESSIETMNAILKAEPPIDVAQTKVSAGLERIVRHCSERNPEDRFQSAHDLAFALGALSGRDTNSAVHAATMPRRRPWLAWGAVGLALAGVAAGAFLLGRRQSPPADRLEFAIPVNGEASHMALSPDGSMLAFVSPDDASGVNMVSVQRIGRGAATVLPGTEGAIYPFWSPDNTYVAFFADGKLRKVAVSGGTPQTLAIAAIPRGGSWGRGGVIIYAPDAATRLWRVNADGSNAASLTDKIYNSRKEASHRWPVFLPDGDHFLFWAGNFQNSSDDTSSGIYFSSLEAKSKVLVAVTRSNPGYSSGYVYYVDGRRTLVAASMDVSSGRVAVGPRVVAEGVGYQPSTYRGAFTARTERTTAERRNRAPAVGIRALRNGMEQPPTAKRLPLVIEKNRLQLHLPSRLLLQQGRLLQQVRPLSARTGAITPERRNKVPAVGIGASRSGMELQIIAGRQLLLLAKRRLRQRVRDPLRLRALTSDQPTPQVFATTERTIPERQNRVRAVDIRG